MEAVCSTAESRRAALESSVAVLMDTNWKLMGRAALRPVRLLLSTTVISDSIHYVLEVLQCSGH